ncbi:MAG: hypothetical protein ACRD2Q_06090 [Terriglobales bacterium]
MDIDEVRALDEQFEKGAPVPEAAPADVKQAWVAARALEAEFGPRPDVATGLGALGFDQSSLSATQFLVIGMRHWLLATLAERGVLRDYQNGDTFDERVYRAAATLPFKRDELLEAVMALKLAASPLEVAAQVKKEFLAHGYDLDHPAIESKFLAWMRDSC